MRRCWLVKLGTPWVLIVGTAGPAAADQPFTLTWQAPEGCPSQSQVEEEIASALSHLRGKGPVEVLAEVTPADEGAESAFRLRVKVTHAGSVGERVLPIDDCDDASRAAALLVALSVENPPPPVIIQVPKKVEEPPQPKPTPPPTVSIGIGPHVVLGMAPEVAAGLGASVAVSYSYFRLSLRGAGFLPSNHTVAGSQAGGRFYLYTGGAFACAGAPGEALSFYGCLGGRYDRLRGEGFGASNTGSRSTQIGSAAAGVTLEWSVTRRFRLRTELEAGYPLGHATFKIQNLEPAVHEVDTLRGEAGLEAAIVF